MSENEKDAEKGRVAHICDELRMEKIAFAEARGEANALRAEVERLKRELEIIDPARIRYENALREIAWPLGSEDVQALREIARRALSPEGKEGK